MPRLRLFAVLLGLAAARLAQGADIPKMKFNEVKEIAPGVFFRLSSISATDKTIPFGGSNHLWVVFEDYVVVIDANFPKEAGDVIEDIKKTTGKPIRYVLDTHHHGDHSYGNAVWARAGASIVAQANCARLLRVNGPKEFADAGRGPTGRKDVAESTLKVPNVVFDDKLVLDDGKQRVEFLFLGHAHTAGDAVAYLPKQKILCTGDACVNGAFNFMGHSDSASWVRVLERMQQLEVEIVAPGHGPLAGKDLIETQKRYFVELRAEVKKQIDAGKSVDDMVKAIDFGWYKQWTGTTPAADNIKHVHDELTGRVRLWDLVEDYGVLEGPSPTKTSPGWTKPKRIVISSGLTPARVADLKKIAPDVEFIPVRNAEEAGYVADDADAVLGFCSADIVKGGKKLRWIQVGSAAEETELFPELVRSKIVLTDMRIAHAPAVADQAFALLLALTRGARLPGMNAWLSPPPLPELNGKNLLVVGLDGIGTQIAQRGHAFGLRVTALDPKPVERPKFVAQLAKPDKLMELLPQADVVVLACPLTDPQRALIGAKQLAAMKESAYLINVARGSLVDTKALAEALEKKQLAGAGLDSYDHSVMKEIRAFEKMSNVIITPKAGGLSPEGAERQWRLFRENVRRFVAGEPLLCVVDKSKGY